MSRLTEKVNYGSSWVETVETDEYIPLNYSTDTMTGKCIDKLGKLEDLEEILKDGFIENGRHHRQIFLAYINNDWVICDNETNEKFSLNDVLKG